MKCLRCEAVDLNIETRGEGTDTFEIDICPDCSGIWLDSKEMARLDDNFFINVEQIDFTATAATAEDKPLTCPRCDGGVEMTKVHPADFSDTVLDTCPTCKGFWLDPGELEKIREVSDAMLIASLVSLSD